MRPILALLAVAIAGCPLAEPQVVLYAFEDTRITEEQSVVFALDVVGIVPANVTFFDNDTPVAELTDKPYHHTWNVTASDTGQHRWTASVHYPIDGARSLALMVSNELLFDVAIDDPTQPQCDPSPYPCSRIIERIDWRLETHVGLGDGSDLWPVTVAEDGNIYTSWGDGGGFGTGSAYHQIGFARISGGPESFTTTNIAGGNNGLNPIPFPTGKTGGMLAIGNTLYALRNMQDGVPPSYDLVWSTDLGATWQASSFHFNSGDFAPSGFVNFRAGYTGTRDDYVYMYGGRWGIHSEIYLVRVPKGQILDVSAYEYYSAVPGGTAQWGALAQRTPIFTDPSSVENASALKSNISYNDKIGRYVLTAYHNGPGGLGIFEGPEPWGPWSTVGYYDRWLGMGQKHAPVSDPTNVGLTCQFPNSWLTNDGASWWTVFSVYGAAANLGLYAHDRFNLIRGDVVFR